MRDAIIHILLDGIFRKKEYSKQWMAIFGNSGTVTKQAYHAFLKQVVCEVCNFNPFVLHRKIDISSIHKYRSVLSK